MDDSERRAAPARRLVVVGCGPHFLERYAQVISERNASLEVTLVVDLESREGTIRKQLFSRQIRPQNCVFLPDHLRNTIGLPEIRARLDPLLQLHPVDAAIICTEPKVRKPYAMWAMENNLPIFSDKPISAFTSIEESHRLRTDFDDLLETSERSGIRYVVSCERRMQPGYRFIEKFLKDFMGRYKAPITSVHIHFGGGTWTTASEIQNLENHPYKYGYGTLLHSGYHYVDLIARLAELNAQIWDINLELPHVMVECICPSRMFEIISPDRYREVLRLAGLRANVSGVRPADFDRFGEVDVSISGRYVASGEHRMSFSAQLLESTASARDIGSQPRGQGRLRQENVHIHLGNFCSISAHSHSAHKLYAPELPEFFDVTIITHPSLACGRPFIHLNREDLSRIHTELPPNVGLNVFARQSQLRDFLDGGCANSHLRTHTGTVALLSEIYNGLASATGSICTNQRS